MDILLFILYLTVAVMGLVAVVFGLPGNFIILTAAVLYAWYGGFEQITPPTIAWLAALAVLGEVVEFALGIAWGKRWKSSNAAIVASIFAGILGALAGAVFWFGAGSVPGAFIGAFLGAFVVEYVKGRGAVQALKSGWGIFIGRVGGIMVKGFIGVAMIVISVVSVVGG